MNFILSNTEFFFRHKIKTVSNQTNNRLINLLICLSLYIYLLIFENIRKKHFEPNYKKVYDFQKNNSNSFFYTFFIENEISKIKKFWNFNRNNALINKTEIRELNNKGIPDISVIITVYNQKNCLFKALRSVQNQSIKSVEIIIVDDGSSDNSLSIILKYQKEDNRIVLLSHMYNYGTIKSRSDAIKVAKGKYITIIDGDDGLASGEILSNCYKISEIGKLDVLEFGYVNFINMNYKDIGKNLLPIDNLNNRIIYQPELKFKFIKLTEKDELWNYLNRQIWAKFIKKEIFKKVLEFIGTKYTDDNILTFEDTIMSVSLFILSKSYYLLKMPGYYRSNNECFKINSTNNKKKCGYNNCIINKNLDSIKYLNFLLEKLNTSKIEMELIYHEFFTIDYHFDLYKKINNNFNYVYQFLEHLIQKFEFKLNKKQIDRIKKFKNRLIMKEKIINNK